MISPTGSGTSPSTPTVSSRPGTNCSTMTSASYARASVTAASSPSALRTNDMPTDDPIFDGFTITGQPSAVATSSGATGGGALNHAGTGPPPPPPTPLAGDPLHPRAPPPPPPQRRDDLRRAGEGDGALGGRAAREHRHPHQRIPASWCSTS